MLGYIFKTKHTKKTPIRGSLNITPRESWAPEIEKTAVAAERLCSTGVGLTVHLYFPGKWYLCRNKMITLSLHLPLHSALQWPAHNMDPENTKPPQDALPSLPKHQCLGSSESHGRTTGRTTPHLRSQGCKITCSLYKRAGAEERQSDLWTSVYIKLKCLHSLRPTF